MIELVVFNNAKPNYRQIHHSTNERVYEYHSAALAVYQSSDVLRAAGANAHTTIIHVWL